MPADTVGARFPGKAWAPPSRRGLAPGYWFRSPAVADRPRPGDPTPTGRTGRRGRPRPDTSPHSRPAPRPHAPGRDAPVFPPAVPPGSPDRTTSGSPDEGAGE